MIQYIYFGRTKEILIWLTLLLNSETTSLNPACR